MDLTKILSVTGRPGLFKVVAQAKNGLIVESIIDKKRLPIHSSQKVSTLADITMFTTGEEDIKLEEVLKKLHEYTESKPTISPNEDDKKLVTYFEKVLPEFDRDRVYASDIRKLFKWYNLLLSEKMISFEEKEVSKESDKEDVKQKEEKKVSKKAVSKEIKSVDEENGKKPVAKKAAANKSTEEKEEKPTAKKAVAKKK